MCIIKMELNRLMPLRDSIGHIWYEPKETWSNAGPFSYYLWYLQVASFFHMYPKCVCYVIPVG